MGRALLSIFIVFALSSCENSAFSENFKSLADTSNREYYPSDDPIVVGKVLFRDEAYGRAYTKFKKALDVYPDDPAAWLGFAASADMLRRFDRADYAYRKLQPIIGNRIEFHNNYGYSLLLRGDLMGARRHFLKAYEIDPSNEYAANNLELLRNSVSFPKRAAGDLKGI
ncbi:hypothetical protein RXV88_18515 [Aestuariicoccus sp. MJ-SS9]|nr:hypothetical protein [Aestuariicoccus sp. MJ-SS9]